MEDRAQQDCNPPKHASENKNEPDRPEPVRSRWTPKPDQILILESIFNSGMVNPPKDETVRIRRLLEKFGSVGDANVFYWFQNRRSRSRRRQRQIQANLNGGQQQQQQQHASQARSGILGSGHYGGVGGSAIQYESGSSCGGLGRGFAATVAVPSMEMALPLAGTSTCLVGSSSSSGVLGNDCGGDDIFSFSGQMGQPQIEQNSSLSNSTFTPLETIDFQYQPGFITVFINGVATDVPRGPLDLKAMVGEDYMLLHSSGIPVPVNEYGFLSQSLHHGESYFVVPRPF